VGNIETRIDVMTSLIANHEYAPTIAKIDALLSSGEVSSTLYSLKGKALFHMRKFEESLKMYEQAIKIDPNSSENLIMQILIQTQPGLYAEASGNLFELNYIIPDSAEVRVCEAVLDDDYGKLSDQDLLKLVNLPLRNPDLIAKIVVLLLHRNMDDLARICAENGLSLDPNHVRLLHLHSLLDLRQNRYVEAKETINQIQDIYPESWYFFWSKANYLLNQENYDEALNVFYSTLKIYPNEILCLNHIKSCYKMIGKHEEALKTCEKIITLRPGNIFELDFLSLAFLELGRFEDAKKVAYDMLEINPNSIQALSRVGFCDFNLKDFDSARNYYNKILQLDTPNVVGYLGLFLIAKAQNHPREAIDILDKGLSNNPGNRLLLVSKAEIYRKLRYYKSEQKILLLLNSSYPKDVKILGALAETHLRLKEYPAAIQVLNQVLKLDPTDKKAWNNLIDAFLAIKQREKAMEVCDSRIESIPKDDNAYRVKGVIYDAMGEITEAFKWYNKALELNPENLDTLIQIGALHSTQNQGSSELDIPGMQLGLNYYTKAHSISPDNIFVWKYLGSVNERLGNFEEAIKWYEKVMEKQWSSKILFRMAQSYEGLVMENEAISCYEALIKKDRKFSASINHNGELPLNYIQIEKNNRHHGLTPIVSVDCYTGSNLLKALVQQRHDLEAENMRQYLRKTRDTKQTTYLNRGRNLIRLGRKDLARKLYRRTITSYPAFHMIQAALLELEKTEH